MKILKPLAIALLLPASYIVTEAGTPVNINTLQATQLLKDSINWNAPLPFDNEVKVGKLKNGFTYYIRKNKEPEKRVTMYLGVKVGSILETEEERGLAHFLEHMNFNGLKHFPKNDLIDYLQKAGVRFGSDLNAYTSFNETVYELPIPSDDPELLKNGLQVMRDWAQDALLTSEEIDKERGVIMEEMRGNRGAQQRMQDQYLPVLFNGSLYAERLPIGTEAVITGFKHQLIRDFHKRWYRPELQSIVIVGDIDPIEMEKEVTRLFSDMQVQKKAAERKKVGIELLNKNQFKVVTDPEMPQTVVYMVIKHPFEETKTYKDYKLELTKGIYSQIINARLFEIAQKPDAPFRNAGVDIDGFLNIFEAMNISIIPKPGQLEESIKVVVRELKRFEKFGATETELQRTLSDYAKYFENSYNERDKKESYVYAKAYLDHFLNNSPVLSNEDSYRITKQILPTITLTDVNAVAEKYYAEVNRDIIILGPEKDKEKMPSETAVNGWLAALSSETLEKYEDKVSELPLLPSTPVKGTVQSTKNLEAIKAKEITLSNGVRVILKPTDFKNDEIIVRAQSEGGHSLYSDADYFSAAYAANLVNSSGLGNLTSVEFRKYLSGKNVNVNAFIDERSEGLSGYSDKEGLKTLFEIIYGYFTAPRLDEDIYQAFVSKTIASMQNREDDPNFVFRSSINKALYGENIRRNLPSEENIRSIDKDRALQIFKERFADASDFTFTIVGSFKEEEILPYLEEYLAGLPSSNSKESAKDLNILPPAKGINVEVHKGKEEKVQVNLSFMGDYAYNDQENINMDALESILNIKLIERLREEESGVYGVGAGASYNKFPKGRYSFSIGFGTSKEKYQSLIKSALDEINKIKQNGPSEVDLNKFVMEKKREYEIKLRENSFWLGSISSAYRLQEDPAKALQYLENLQKVNAESIKAVANKYLLEDRLFKFILLPDKK